MKASNGALTAVRRELMRTVTRTPRKVFAKLTGQPWPPVGKNPWSYNEIDGYGVPLHHQSLQTAEIQTLVGKTNPLILEIGANNGEDSRRFLDQFGQMKLFCFEPDPRAIAKFKHGIVDDRCTLIEKAVAANTGTTSFWQSAGDFDPHNPDWDRSGSIHAPTGHLQAAPEIEFRNVVKVPTVSLDDWAAGHPELETIDFVWMDVQGAEHDVFAGGVKTFSKVRYVYSEFNQNPMYEGAKNLDDLLAMLPGFELLAFYDNCNFLAKNQRHKQR